MAEEDKTEAPTGRKITESRRKGEVGRSPDLTSAIVMIAAIAFLYFFGGGLVRLHLVAARFLLADSDSIELSLDNLPAQAMAALSFVMAGVLPMMLLVLAAALLANILQVGLLFAPERLLPDFGRLDPIKGLTSRFSMRTLVHAAMNLAKVALVSWIAWKVLAADWNDIFRLTGGDILTSLRLLASTFFKLAFWMALVLLVLGLLDFLYQKWNHYQNLMMTRHEVKDELRNYEGDPRVKQRRRQIQMQMARQRMMRDVKDADVVITNPTHLSVALKYDETTMRAPVVVAKGADILALRIREIAKEHGVPLVENRELARNIYRLVDVGDPVPEKLFKAVAEILAYVYGLKGRKVAAL